MVWVMITGWTAGFNKVKCTKLLQEYAQLPLSEAKARTDRCLLGESVAVDMTSPEAAQELSRLLTDIHAITLVAPVRQ